ncbi:MAG TPA: HAMP domain-containing protein, partial [Rhodospirillales bacterium]|nr:HAMP domain-containing protein [Rhodospirillales bacterium]
ERDERVRAVVKLASFNDAYLLVGRFIDPGVLEHIYKTAGAVAEYKSLEKEQEGFQLTFLMIFVVVTVLLLLAAIWIGLTLATQLARPISNLILAAEQVREGNFEVSVDASDSTDEIGALSRAFLRMTRKLKTQRQGLMEANRQLDERRRFTETVLSGVSAGVIGLDGKGLIHLPNRSASELLAADLEKAVGKSLKKVVPEMSSLFEKVKKRPDRLRQAELTLVRDGAPRTLLVRIAAERLDEDVIGYVVTFDDVTELMSAQRQAAWSDVARRIAHEIKNPLTPIQLSAERLKRKYLKEIKSDPETFSICTETIIRQVADIGRMVDEFSSFARMPQPDMKLENLQEICRDAVFMEKNRHTDIEYDTEFPEEGIFLRCDSRQLSQALINLLKNASESVDGREKPPKEDLAPGWVKLTLSKKETPGGATVRIVVEDNGVGLPKEDRDRLTEPYVTGRSKGTGLGLAIIKKIMEDHNGDLILDDRKEGGARITMVFRRLEEADAEPENANEPKDELSLN